MLQDEFTANKRVYWTMKVLQKDVKRFQPCDAALRSSALAVDLSRIVYVHMAKKHAWVSLILPRNFLLER